MRSFNSNFVTEKNKRADGPTPINLLQFGFSTPVLLSDRDVTPSGGSAHFGLVKSWGFIDSAINQTPGRGLLGSIEIVDLKLVIINSQSPRFSDKFTAVDPLEGVDVTLYQWFGGLLDSEKEVIFKGRVHKQPEYDLDTCTVTVRGIWKKYDTLIGEDLVISADDYSGADPDAIGKMLPMVIGSCERVVFRAVAAGGKNNLSAVHNSTVTTFNISDTSTLSSSGTFQVDAEQITYTGKTATTFTGCTRGANSTTAVDHNQGATVAQIQTEYIYLMGHAVKAINAVYVDDVLQASGYTAYTGQSGDEHASYPGKACIKFTTLPTLSKQVNVSVSDTIGVNDGIGVTDNIGMTVPGTSKDRYPSGNSSSNCSDPSYAYDGNGNTCAQVFHISLAGNLVLTFPATNYGTISEQNFFITATTSGGGDITVQDSDGYSLGTMAAGVTTPATWRFRSTRTAWALGIKFITAGGENVNVYEAHKEVTYTASGTKSGSASKTGSATKTGTVSLSGNSVADTVIGGQVTVSVDGYRDDATGTITGTANSLIERCDNVFEYIWTNLLSAPSADVDSTTFGAAGTFYNTNAYKFAMVIDQPIQASSLLVKLALQCRSRVLVTPAGVLKLIVRQTGQTSGHSIPKNEMRQKSVKMRHTDSDDILNYFRIYYDRDNRLSASAAGSYTGNKPFTDSTSVSRYQTRTPKRKELLYFDAVNSSAMITSVGNFILNFYKQARKMPLLSVFLDNMEIEPGDIIDLTHPLDSMSGYVVEVLKTVHKMGSARRKVIDHVELVTIQN